ncbi:MAG: hypothetical protein ABEK17_02135 [Candidatus Aenigmatarchaeota archaeon]
MKQKTGKIYVFKEGIPISKVKDISVGIYEKKDHIQMISARPGSFIEGSDNYYSTLMDFNDEGLENFSREIIEKIDKPILDPETVICLEFDIPPYYSEDNNWHTGPQYYTSPEGHKASKIKNDNLEDEITNVFFSMVERKRDNSG